jgi:hypothetical protein
MVNASSALGQKLQPTKCEQDEIVVNPGVWADTNISLRQGQVATITARGLMRYKEGARIEFPPGGDQYGVWSLKAMVESQIVNVGGSGYITANFDGKLKLGAPATLTHPIEEGSTYLDPKFHYCAKVKVASDHPAPRELEAYAMIEDVAGSVQARDRSGAWIDASYGAKLDAGFELRTGPGSYVVLTFPAGARFTLKELSHVAIGQILSRAGRARIRILLRMGEAASKVKPKGAVQTDFEIQMPTATASIRGTILTVRYDDKTATSSVSVEEGEVLVTPTNTSLQTVTLLPGQSVDVTNSKVGQVRSRTGTTVAAGRPAFGPLHEGEDLFEAGDYRSFSIAEPRVQICLDECGKDMRCRSVTYTKPGTYGAPTAICWLKERTGRFGPHANAISAVKLQ